MKSLRVRRAPSRATTHSALLLVLLLLAGAPPVRADEAAPAPPRLPASCQETIPELFERVSKAVVSITATSIDPYESVDRMVRLMGSGFLIDPSGLILTNSHVVFGQQIIMVTLDDGTSLPAQVVGADPLLDVALIRVAPPAGTKLPAAQFGDSAHLLVGEEVFAIGNPFGLDQTLTRGIVSAVNRILPGAAWSVREPLIQTDAAINPGSSGGPLVNRCGEVIGINTSILPDAQSIGFSVPIHLAKGVIPDLMLDGRVIRPWIGIQGQLVSAGLKELLRAPLADGFLVEVVEPRSPAGRAGVRGGDVDLMISGQPVLIGGDVITEMNGAPFTDGETMGQAIATLRVGETVRLKLFRDKEVRQVEMVVVERPLLPGDTSPKRTVSPAGSSAAPAGTRRHPSSRRAL
ncbi:MAG TPA: trypsin-like peptidase domain-containing protein [Thermoanaerobaculia bacterium]|nr:trypsin-like peptidase domain-containing protein [Thermoanaerobaculia bacterium]